MCTGSTTHGIVNVIANNMFYLFQLVGIYILSGNPGHVVYTNCYIYIHLLQLVGVYILSGFPEHVVLGDNVTVTLTCIVDDNHRCVTCVKEGINIANITNGCELGNGADPIYTYTCDLANTIYHLIIPPDAITDGIQNSVCACIPVIGTGSNTWRLRLSGTYGV